LRKGGGRLGENVGWRGNALRALVLGFELLIFAGLPVFLFHRHLAVFLMLAAVIGLFLTRLTIGIVSYRQTMRRPWPKVPPIEDDEDEW
jgi:hypothetical protein